MTAHDRLIDLLLQWEELREQGQVVSAAELCRDCPELMDEVRRRIRFMAAVDADGEVEAGAETMSDAPASLQTDAGNRPIRPGSAVQVAGYDLQEELGRGGMGVVYKARQTSLDRHVALKIILAGAHAGADQLARFQLEAEAAARLQHPNIVQVYEIGKSNGCPYYCQEYIDGRCLRDAITEYAQPARAAALIEALAGAVAYAHERGILHRDLKPANILLTRDGTPKITDFGLAKRLDDAEDRTRTGDVLGTPAYMAPEQAAGKVREFGPATDIYALGAVLYELLTGRPPFQAATTWEVINQVIAREPMPPSQRRARIPRDLETICLKCLQKEPGKRYQGAGALADDLRRFREGRPIAARPAGSLERLRKWVRRRPALAALIGVSTAALLALSVGGWVASLRLYQREQALEAQVKATRQALIRLNVANGKNLLDGENDYASLIWFARALNLEADEARRAPHRIRFAAVLRECPRLAQLWFHRDNVNDVAFSPDGRWGLTAGADHTARVWDVDTGQPRFDPPLRHEGSVRRAVFCPQGRRIVTASDDQTARIWDAVTGRLLASLKGHTGPVADARFSPDGRRVVTASEDRTARIWDADTGQPVGDPLLHEGAVVRACFHPAGGLVLTAGTDRAAGLWKLEGATAVRAVRLQHDGNVADACFDPQGKQIATASDDGTARLWDAVTGTPLGAPLRHHGAVRAVVFRPDGAQVATASLNAVQFWEAGTGQATGVVLRHYSVVNRIGFSPDGKRVVTASDDNSACVWDSSNGRPLTPPLTHIGSVHQACFSPDGRRIATAAFTARVYELGPGPGEVPALKHDGPVVRAAFSPAGDRVLTAGEDRTARLWDARTGRGLAVLRGHTRALLDAAFSPDGRRVATASGDATARVWDAATFHPLVTLTGHAGPVCRVAFSPDGSRVVTAGHDGSARIWDTADGAALHVLSPPPGPFRGEILDACFSPDGRLVATAGADRVARLWDAATGKPLGPPLSHERRVLRLAFSPDGRRLATACFDGSARLWDTDSGKPLLPAPLRHPAPVLDIVFSPDGGRVLTCGEDNTARIWSAVDGAQLVPAMRHRGTVAVARFGADGSRVATASADDSGRVWDAATGEPLTPPLRHQGWGRITDAAFDPTGNRVVTAGVDGTAQVWELSGLDWPAPDLERLAELLGGHRIGADAGGLVPLDAEALRRRWEELCRRHPGEFGARR